MNDFNQSPDIFDFESATQVARLILQDRVLTESMQELVPSLRKFHRILDIGCGPGGWAVDAAKAFPRSKVIGIDRSQAMLNYATLLAKTHGLKNCKFLQMDALKSLAFADRSFDLVNIRIMGTVIPKLMWPMLLKDCYRILQPGGLLQLTECEGMQTRSNALEAYNLLCAQFLSQKGYSFSFDGLALGMTSEVLIQLLQQGGYRNTSVRSSTLEFSAGMELHDPQRQIMELFFMAVQEQLILSEVAAREEIENMHATLSKDLSSQTFQGSLLFHTVWGERG